MGLFGKKKDRSASTSNGGGSSALSGMKFKTAGGGGPGGARPAARPSWNTSLGPDRNAAGGDLGTGIAFFDCRVALVPPKELGALLIALNKANIRPVLVPSVLKIVAGVLKTSGKWGVMNDRSVLESHLKAALDAANAPDTVVANLNPGLDLYWLEEKKYALPTTVEEGVWRALVDGIDEQPAGPGGSVLSKAGKDAKDKPAEAIKQSTDRLTITHEIVTVCRHTASPHLLFTADSVIESAAIKDLGGPDLAARTFEMGKNSSFGWSNPASQAEQTVNALLDRARQPVKNGNQNPVTVPAPTAGLGVSPSNGMSVSPETWRRPCADDFNDPYGEYERGVCFGCFD